MLDIIVSPTSMNLIKECTFCDGFIIGEENKALRLPHYFNFNEILEIVDLVKNRNQKVYIACNKIIHEDELALFDDYINKLKSLPIDGIIFGDLALYNIAKKYHMINKLIYNPETYLTNYESVHFYARKGIKGVSIAKEITLEDIALIASKQYLAIDVLGHGALNMFHSMRDLVSNYYRFLKDNEPEKHRKESLYIIEEIRDEKYPIIEDQNGTHVYSAMDVCTIEYLDNFIENHVSSIRIEGLFKKDNVLLEIVKVYKQAIEDYKKNANIYKQNKKHYLNLLENIQNIRPFNEGFLFKKTVYKGDEINGR